MYYKSKFVYCNNICFIKYCYKYVLYIQGVLWGLNFEVLYQDLKKEIYFFKYFRRENICNYYFN